LRIADWKAECSATAYRFNPKSEIENCIPAGLRISDWKAQHLQPRIDL